MPWLFFVVFLQKLFHNAFRFGKRFRRGGKQHILAGAAAEFVFHERFKLGMRVKIGGEITVHIARAHAEKQDHIVCPADRVPVDHIWVEQAELARLMFMADAVDILHIPTPQHIHQLQVVVAVIRHLHPFFPARLVAARHRHARHKIPFDALGLAGDLVQHVHFHAGLLFFVFCQKARVLDLIAKRRPLRFPGVVIFPDQFSKLQHLPKIFFIFHSPVPPFGSVAIDKSISRGFGLLYPVYHTVKQLGAGKAIAALESA